MALNIHDGQPLRRVQYFMELSGACDRTDGSVLKRQAAARLYEGMLLAGHAARVYASAATGLNVG